MKCSGVHVWNYALECSEVSFPKKVFPLIKYRCLKNVLKCSNEINIFLHSTIVEVQPEEHCNSPANKWQEREAVQHAPLGLLWRYF